MKDNVSPKVLAAIAAKNTKHTLATQLVHLLDKVSQDGRAYIVEGSDIQLWRYDLWDFRIDKIGSDTMDHMERAHGVHGAALEIAVRLLGAGIEVCPPIVPEPPAAPLPAAQELLEKIAENPNFRGERYEVCEIENDRCVVFSLDRMKRHPQTGDMQPAMVYAGTREECETWANAHGATEEDLRCDCDDKGYAIFNADPENGVLGDVQRCDTCEAFASDQDAWRVARGEGVPVGIDGEVLAVPAVLPLSRHFGEAVS